MTDNSRFEAANKRLDKALEGLELAVVKGKQAGEIQHSLEAQIADLIADRDRLAQELDQERARVNRFGETKSRVSERIDAVMDNIRLLLSDV